MPDGGPAWWPAASRTRRGVLLLAAVAMLLQAVLLLTVPASGWAVQACAIAALAAVAVLLREARGAAPCIGIRAVGGTLETWEPDGTIRPASAVLASASLIVLRIEAAGRAGRFHIVWRDTLPAAEFRRLLAAARWTRQSVAPRSAV